MNLGIFSASTGAALSVTWPGLVEWIKLTSLVYFIAVIKQGKFFTHTDIHRHRQTYCLLLQTITVIFVDLY